MPALPTATAVADPNAAPPSPTQPQPQQGDGTLAADGATAAPPQPPPPAQPEHPGTAAAPPEAPPPQQPAPRRSRWMDAAPPATAAGPDAAPQQPAAADGAAAAAAAAPTGGASASSGHVEAGRHTPGMLLAPPASLSVHEIQQQLQTLRKAEAVQQALLQVRRRWTLHRGALCRLENVGVCVSGARHRTLERCKHVAAVVSPLQLALPVADDNPAVRAGWLPLPRPQAMAQGRPVHQALLSSGLSSEALHAFVLSPHAALDGLQGRGGGGGAAAKAAGGGGGGGALAGMELHASLKEREKARKERYKRLLVRWGSFSCARLRFCTVFLGCLGGPTRECTAAWLVSKRQRANQAQPHVHAPNAAGGAAQERAAAADPRDAL